MSTATETIETLVKQEYKYGFITDLEADSAPPGLSEDTIRLISLKKKEPEWLLEWRLKAFRHWLTMPEPTWQFVKYPKIDFQDITYYSAPKQKTDGPKSLDEVDPKLLETYEKLGIPLRERERLAGVAVDAVARAAIATLESMFFMCRPPVKFVAKPRRDSPCFRLSKAGVSHGR
jgi:Fe-S cluster assembly protein SufB